MNSIKSTLSTATRHPKKTTKKTIKMNIQSESKTEKTGE